MAEIKIQHNSHLHHHLHQAMAWLSASANGENTAALSYAAFELRFAIERIAVYYWATLLNKKPEEQDFRDMESFKRIERRIYELAGHQKEIDAHFEFIRTVNSFLKINSHPHTPNIGELSNYWRECSGLCHICWPLTCSAPEVRKGAFTKLTNISNALIQYVSSDGWPVIHDSAFTELRNNFVLGNANRNDIFAHIEKRGIWAREVYPDGRPPESVGECIAPKFPNSKL